jgi:hypothetical protein
MYLESNDHVEVGKIDKQRMVSPKDEDPASFSLTVLVLLLHKYSSYWYDDLFLKVRSTRKEPDQIVELHYSISDDQTFYSLYSIVKKDVSVLELSPLDGLDVEWVNDGAEIALKCRIRLTPSGVKLFGAVFSSDPHSRFHQLFQRASRDYRILASNAETEIPVGVLDYLTERDLDNLMH